MSELCKWEKDDYEKKLEKLLKVVKDPRFICAKCGRAAHRRKHLCKPVPLPAADPE